MTAGGGHSGRAIATIRAQKAAGMAAARRWRESRRCEACGTLAYIPCIHRPDGFGTIAVVREEWPIAPQVMVGPL